MVVFSLLRPLFRIQATPIKNGLISRSMSDHRTFPLQPSRWQWNKFKDLLHFYVLIGVIPLTVLVTCANIFIGPATLTEIPEGYEPKYWEYYRSPITRFIAKYMVNSPQQEYEKFLAHIFIEDEKIKLRRLEKEIKTKMGERNDYQAYYYRPVLAKYHRISREAAEYLETIQGE